MLPRDIQKYEEEDQRHMQINMYIGLISNYKTLQKQYRLELHKYKIRRKNGSLKLRKYKVLRKKCILTIRDYKSRQRQLEKELPALLAYFKE